MPGLCVSVKNASMGGMQQQAPQFNEEALLQKATERMQQQIDEQRKTQEAEQQRAYANDIANKYLDRCLEAKSFMMTLKR